MLTPYPRMPSSNVASAATEATGPHQTHQNLMALKSLPSTNSVNSKSLFDISKVDVSLARMHIKKFYRYCRYYDHKWMTFKDLHFLGLFRGHQRNNR